MKTTLIDLSGQRFGQWLVAGSHVRTHNKTLWLCRCDCGTKRHVNGAELRNGKSTNCGCVRRAKVAARNYKHGMGSTALHARWQGMIARCENPNHKGYKRYGAKGITVCGRWRESFTAWLADMGPPPSPRHTIERKDNRGNYEPGNCVWATNKENCNNTSRNRVIEHDGLQLTLSQWSERTGIEHHTIAYRIDRYGWSVHEALTIPVLRHSETRKRRATPG